MWSSPSPSCASLGAWGGSTQGLGQTLYVKNALRPDAEVEPSLATAVTDPMLLQQVQNGFG